MRKILFRCKRKDNGEWVYWDMLGRITTHTGKISKATIKSKYGEHYYYFAHQLWDKLDRPTIGQYTGLMDKNGKRIFEGDIVKYLDYSMVVIWYEEHSAFALAFSVDGNYYETISKADTYLEVIGNIHDNPKFLGGENDG